MRIVPLVTKETQIQSAEELCTQSSLPLFAIKPYRKLKVGIIITGSEIYSGRIKDRFEPIIREKLGYFDATILGCTICDDKIEMLQEAAKGYLEKGVDLLIFTGGMSVDPDDLTPSAIKNTGAQIITQGVPIQPGNTFSLAYLGDTTLIGVPGGGIFNKTTVLDVVLPQIFTGEKFTKNDFIAMAEGGSCLSCEICHYPICTYGRY